MLASQRVVAGAPACPICLNQAVSAETSCLDLYNPSGGCKVPCHLMRQGFRLLILLVCWNVVLSIEVCQEYRSTVIFGQAKS